MTPGFGLSNPLADPAATAALHPGLQHTPATARNRELICRAMAELLPRLPCVVPEIASGSGEHPLWMTRSLPQVTWMPSEASADGLAAVEGWLALYPELAQRVAAGADRRRSTALARLPYGPPRLDTALLQRFQPLAR